MVNRTKLLKYGVSAFVILNFFAVNSNFIFAQENSQNYKPVNALDVVNAPNQYLNQNVKITATFDKFSTLGLDYKPAFKDSKKFISFLIRRPDVADHDIPLSELKLIISRDKAEKLTDLETGNKIELTGKEFSNALGDSWIEVDSVKNLTPKAKKETSDSSKVGENKTSSPAKK